MKRALLLGVGLALAAAAPAQAAEHVVTRPGRRSRGTSRTSSIPVGDTVTWQFPGTTQTHNVQHATARHAGRGLDGFASPIGVAGAERVVHVQHRRALQRSSASCTAAMTGVVTGRQRGCAARPCR